jgi:hypothetical protein
MRVFEWVRRQLKDRRSRRRRVSLWLLEDQRAGYLANPKAASSAIRNLIRDREAERMFGRAAGEDRALRSRVEARVRRSMTPAQVARVRGQLMLFSFVRNPLTRLYSCYRDKVVNAASTREACTLEMYDIQFGMTFDEFVCRVAGIPDEQADQHFRSQHTFLMHGDTLLVHHLGRLETFAADWRLIEERMGLPMPGHFHRVSGPKIELAAIPIGATAAERAVSRYRRDLEAFGYMAEVTEWMKGLKK